MVYASHFLAPHRRRFPIPCPLPILFFSCLVSEETNFHLVFHLSVPGTHRRSRMPSSDLGEGWPFFALHCSFVSTSPEYGGLVRVALCRRNLVSFHPSWAVAGGGVGVFSPLAWRGSEADLLMVTCAQSWFPGVPGVELFCGEAGIVEVFCWIPGIIVFKIGRAHV